MGYNGSICILTIILVSCVLATTSRIQLVTGTTSQQKETYISIDGNGNFTLTAKNEHWSGNGSLINPIIMSSLSTQLPLNLEIKNTTLHFIIENNIFNLATYLDLTFINATNGIIRNNIITINNYNSNIDLINCSDFTIDNNQIEITNTKISNIQYLNMISSSNIMLTSNEFVNQEVYVSDSSNMSILLNKFEKSFNGLWVYKSKNVSIKSNEANLTDGFILEGISGSMIDNTFEQSGLNELLFSNNFIFSNNTINNEQIFLVLNQSNTPIPKSVGQLILVNSSNELLMNQKIISILSYNSRNIALQNLVITKNLDSENCNNVTIKNSVFTDKTTLTLANTNNANLANNILNTDISLYNDRMIIIKNNTIINYYQDGLFIQHSNNVIIELNQIHDLNKSDLSLNTALSGLLYGIVLISSNNSKITNNYIFDEINGISLVENSNNNTVSNNIIHDNFYYGIDIEYVKNSAIVNNTIYNNMDGIILSFGYNITIIHNTIYRNDQGIVLAGNNILNTIKDNNIYDNKHGDPQNQALSLLITVILISVALVLLVAGYVKREALKPSVKKLTHKLYGIRKKEIKKN